MDDFRLPLIAAPLAAGAASLALLPVLIRARILPDQPNERSLHSAPVPRSGGIAIMLPVLICGWLAAPEFRLALACALLLALMSFLDDLRPLSPALRLLVHVLAAVALIFFGFDHWSLMLALGAMIATVWMTNLYNFMDGSDGLAGGMSTFGFACYALIAAMQGHAAIAVVSACIAVCAMTFLLFNFHPAKIFMGDTGSIPLGFLAAAVGITGWDRGLWPAYVPVLIFSPFIVDATVTLIHRLANREKIWVAHRNHYYQRLVRMGMGHRSTALAEYALMAAATISAVAMTELSAGFQITLLAIWISGYVALAMIIDRRWRHHQERTDGSI